MKSKNCSNKHDHKITKIIKATLYAIIMLQPLIIISINVLPYIWNESNALSSIDLYSQAEQLMIGNNIISWVNTTAIYTAINNMFTTLNVNSQTIIYLLTYWLMITAIYIVIDIVIETFVYLTHWFNDKMV